MEVDKAVIKLIVKECCRGIEYDEILQQYSFALMPELQKIWQKIRPELRIIMSGFREEDFSAILTVLTHLQSNFIRVPISDRLLNTDLLPSEILELTINSEKFVMTKMGAFQYLTSTGEGVTLPLKTCFGHDRELITSEGKSLGTIQEVCLRCPSEIHIAASAILLSGYYKNGISSSLWELYGHSERLRINGGNYSALLQIACNMGIGLLSLFTIINSFKR